MFESRGGGLSKDLFEGSTTAAEEVSQGEEHGAEFHLSCVEKEGSNMGLIIASAALTGGVALVALFYLTYRAGRRQFAAG